MANRIDRAISEAAELVEQVCAGEKAIARAETPYPRCKGSPTREACAERGFCDRDPNCGE